ncbi:MAG: YHYH protein [Gammaproteobacteria bacterium]
MRAGLKVTKVADATATAHATTASKTTRRNSSARKDVKILRDSLGRVVILRPPPLRTARPTESFFNATGDQACADSGELDECNGMEIDGQYGYYLMDGDPWIVDCLAGLPDLSFRKL